MARFLIPLKMSKWKEDLTCFLCAPLTLLCSHAAGFSPCRPKQTSSFVQPVMLRGDSSWNEPRYYLCILDPTSKLHRLILYHQCWCPLLPRLAPFLPWVLITYQTVSHHLDALRNNPSWMNIRKSLLCESNVCPFWRNKCWFRTAVQSVFTSRNPELIMLYRLISLDTHRGQAQWVQYWNRPVW